MLSAQDFSSLRIRRVIFHDVPRGPKGSSNEPTLADVTTDIDAHQSSLLKNRLTRALGSTSAYEVEFNPDATSPIPASVSDLTEKDHHAKTFVEKSQTFAKYLAEQQVGNISSGLLCVIDAVTRGHAAVAILKLERERGANIELEGKQGHRRFAMSVLESLVFTEGTRLFKSAVFIRVSKGQFRSAVCDSQRPVTTSTEVAHFWLRFLGCRFAEHPRITTQKWFEASLRYINECVTDPVAKNDITEALHAELKSQRQTISPRVFLENYLSDEYREGYIAFLQQNKIPLQNFEKDLSDIENKLRRYSFRTTEGVTLTAPAEKKQLITVEADQIVVRDQLESVS